MAKKRSNQADAARKIKRKDGCAEEKKSGATKELRNEVESGVSANGLSTSQASTQIFLSALFFVAGIATRPLLFLWNDDSLANRKLTTKTPLIQPGRTHAFDVPSGETRSRGGDVSTGSLRDFSACDDAKLSEFFHASPQRGMHIVCLGNDTPGDVSLRLFRGAYNDTQTKPLVKIDLAWRNIRKLLETNLSLPPSGPLQQPWAIFTPEGERLVGADDEIVEEESVTNSLLRSGMLIVMEGGIWIWPGVRVGFERTIDLNWAVKGHDSARRKATIETLSLRPLVVSVKGFISKEECKEIQHLAKPTLKYSGVSLMDKDKGKPASNWRTSQSTFLPSGHYKTMQNLERRTASLTRIPKNHQEHLQVLRYGNGEKYDAHHDYFNPEMYKNDKHTMMQIQNGKRNRVATVFWYLSDVAKGGETIFPRSGGAPQPMDFSDCSRGLKVKPEEGKVIIFYSLDAAGKLDPLSLHGACKVEEGIKWAANKWVWNAPRDYVSND